jgi:hypothetical protein
VQDVVDVHDTAFNAALSAGEIGTFWVDQLVPFHSSTSGSVEPSDLTEPTGPTATQKLADLHDTPVKPGPLTPLGFTGLSTVQLEPSHRAANGAAVVPTAMQNDAVGHETSVSCAPEGIDVDSTLQLWASALDVRSVSAETAAAAPTSTLEASFPATRIRAPERYGD